MSDNNNKSSGTVGCFINKYYSIILLLNIGNNKVTKSTSGSSAVRRAIAPSSVSVSVNDQPLPLPLVANDLSGVVSSVVLLNEQEVPVINNNNGNNAAVNVPEPLYYILNSPQGPNKKLYILACNFSQNTIDIGMDNFQKPYFAVWRLYNCEGNCVVLNVYGTGPTANLITYLTDM